MEAYWEEARKNYKEYEPVKENLKTRVCVIGGGLTGLSTAYYLSRETDVIVVEKEHLCSHTSGKNTGKITSQHGVFYNYLVESQGTEFAKKYLQANEEAIDEIRKIVSEEKIECDLKSEDAIVFTAKETDVDILKEEQKVVRKLKKDDDEFCKFVKNIEMPMQIAGAVKFKNQAQFNPLKYGYGLASVIEKNGGKIFENSQVTDIKRKENIYEIHVNNKIIEADEVVVATRYPFVKIPGYYFLKMYQSTSFAMVFDCKKELFGGMYISYDFPTTSFRVIDDGNRKLLLAVGYDYKTGTDDMKNGYMRLKTVVEKMYPNAEEICRWSAEDCISLDKIPYIGEYSSLMPKVYVATGFNKWGITASNIASRIIKDKILGKENKYEEIFDSRRVEPIKNIKEVGNMLKEANKSILLSRFKTPKTEFEDIQIGEGKIIEIDNTKVGVYKDNKGEVYEVKPVCTHLGCELKFNNIDKVWECPCHGSKFSFTGESIEGPGNSNLMKG